MTTLSTTSSINHAIASFLLSCINRLEETLSMSNWNSRLIAIAAAVLFGILRKKMDNKYGIDWYPFVHAILTGIGSAICVYLNVVLAETLTGTEEPLRTVCCEEPITSLHSVIPAITMGYALLDILDGFSHGIDFVLHGVATFSVMAYFTEYNASALITPMLLMEISTIPLSMMRATIFTSTQTMLNMAMFVLTFFSFRCLYVPYLWYHIQIAFYSPRGSETFTSCMPWHMPYVIFVFGSFFHCLNSFWFYKIVRKVQRKLNGSEKLRDRNDLKEKETTNEEQTNGTTTAAKANGGPSSSSSLSNGHSSKKEK